jgi:putative oxidoreductase
MVKGPDQSGANNMKDFSLLLGRVLIAHVFILAGLQKISQFDTTQGYMASQGVPGNLLWLVILLEVGGGLAVVLGWQTRLAATALAAFSIAAALIFHWDFANQMQAIMFMKNMAIAGGFLFLAAWGPGDLSVDNLRSRPVSD